MRSKHINQRKKRQNLSRLAENFRRGPFWTRHRPVGFVFRRSAGRDPLRNSIQWTENRVELKHSLDSRKGRNIRGQTGKNGVGETHNRVNLHERPVPRSQGWLRRVFKVLPWGRGWGKTGTRRTSLQIYRLCAGVDKPDRCREGQGSQKRGHVWNTK